MEIENPFKQASVHGNMDLNRLREGVFLYVGVRENINETALLQLRDLSDDLFCYKCTT